MALVLAAYLVLLGRLAYWQVWRHSDMARLAAAYHDDTITLPAVRGNILDRNGALLVTNTPVFSVFASPDLLSAAERTDVSTRLAPLLQLSAADIQAKLATTRQFVYLARRVPSSVAQQLDAMRLPGIGKVAETQRSYVDGGVAGTSLAANLLGFANDEGQGNYGVEGYYNKTLAGQAGFEATVRDLANRPIVLSDRQRRDPVNGMTLQLSLDSTVQVVAERALADGVQKYQAESGSLIIMEPATGRIVAWADVPSYNANQFATTATAQFIDPIVSSLYHPGHALQRDRCRRRRWRHDPQLGQPGSRERHDDAGPAELAQCRCHQGPADGGRRALLPVPAKVRHRHPHRRRRGGGDGRAAAGSRQVETGRARHGLLRPGGRHHPDRDAGRHQRGGQRRQSRLAARRGSGDRCQRGPPSGSAADRAAGGQRQDRAADATDDDRGGRARLRNCRAHRRLQEQ